MNTATSKGAHVTDIDAGPPAREITVFAGPSLRPADVADLQETASSVGVRLRFRPPVRRHDLVDLVDAHTAAEGGVVVVLDGEFGQSLAISVAEVRAALSAGLRIHGASSMGVLRAVECRTLGMTGSGWVYDQYLTGKVDSDAEVALLFDPFDHRPVTVPLINIRWLLEQRAASGQLTEEERGSALEVAAGLHYRDRRPSVLAARWRGDLPVRASSVLEPELDEECLDTWDRKRSDAIEALRKVMVA